MQIQQQQLGASAIEKDMCDKAVEALPKEGGAMPQLSATSTAPLAEVLTKEGEEAEQASEVENGTVSMDTEITYHAVDLSPTMVLDLPSYVLLLTSERAWLCRRWY